MSSYQRQICGQSSKKQNRKNSTSSKIVHIDAEKKTATPLINTGIMAVFDSIKCQRWDFTMLFQKSPGVSTLYPSFLFSFFLCTVIFSIHIFHFPFISGALRPQSLLLRKLASSAFVITRTLFACWRHIPNPLRMTSLMSSCALTL